MSDYHFVTTLHAARVALADVLKSGVGTRRRAGTVALAEAQVAAARAAVVAALADGRVVSAKHLLDLDFDCLGAILSQLGPRDALSTARTCTTLRSALFHGGLPGPLAGVCYKQWLQRDTAAAKEAALRALNGMEPALGAHRLEIDFSTVGGGEARVLARALDAAPRATRIDIKFSFLDSRDRTNDAARLADVLSSHDRAFAAPPQVHVQFYKSQHVGALLRLTRAGVCIASVEEDIYDQDFISARLAANTLTKLRIGSFGTDSPRCAG